jgi:hypothetical protein
LTEGFSLAHPCILLLFTLACAFCAALEDVAPVAGEPWGGKLPKQPPRAVPVVKTWAALSALKPFEVADGIKVRLGIEAAEAPCLSGVLVYALVEGFQPNEFDDPETQLGPLKLVIKTPGDADLEKLAAKKQQQARQMGDWDGAALFCRVLPLRNAGDHTVRFLTQSGTELATATVRSHSAPYHAWSVFHSVRWNEIEEAPQDGLLTGYLAYTRFDPALPYLSGADPLLVVEDAAQKRDAPLPRLQDTPDAVAAPEVPDSSGRIAALVKALAEDDFDLRENASRELRGLLPDALPQLEKARSHAADVETRTRLEGLIRSALAATLHIQASSAEATLTFPGGLHASWPEDYYLVRWWVNDKPVILEPNKELQMFQKVGAMRMGEQMRLRWKIDWPTLGAKSGDRVALQLMYCPAGVRRMLDADQLLAMLVLEFGQKPVLSNRTEFVLP